MLGGVLQRSQSRAGLRPDLGLADRSQTEDLRATKRKDQYAELFVGRVTRLSARAIYFQGDVLVNASLPWARTAYLLS